MRKLYGAIIHEKRPDGSTRYIRVAKRRNPRYPPDYVTFLGSGTNTPGEWNPPTIDQALAYVKEHRIILTTEKIKVVIVND